MSGAVTAGIAPTDEALPSCPVCGERNWPPPLAGTRLRPCRGCGTVYHDRSTSREEEEGRYGAYTDAPGAYEEVVASEQWAWVEREFRRVDSVLDIGCGHGAFLNAARARGCRTAGVELDPAGAASCREQGLDVRHGSFFDVGVPPGPWALITLWDVLEHLEHPRLALDALLPELACGGVLVLRGRNAATHAPFKARYARMRPLLTRLRIPDVSCVHRWGFDLAGYRKLLADCGLEQIRAYAGVPTSGDRSGAHCPAAVAGAIKGNVRTSGFLLHRVEAGRWYPFPSVLIAARRPDD